MGVPPMCDMAVSAMRVAGILPASAEGVSPAETFGHSEGSQLPCLAAQWPGNPRRHPYYVPFALLLSVTARIQPSTVFSAAAISFGGRSSLPQRRR